MWFFYWKNHWINAKFANIYFNTKYEYWIKLISSLIIFIMLQISNIHYDTKYEYWIKLIPSLLIFIIIQMFNKIKTVFRRLSELYKSINCLFPRSAFRFNLFSVSINLFLFSECCNSSLFFWANIFRLFLKGKHGKQRSGH